MNRIATVLMQICVLCFGCSSLTAEPFRRFELVAACISPDPIKGGVCDGYFQGVSDAIGWGSSLAGCRLVSLSGNQLRELFFKHISENPYEKGGSAIHLIRKAVAEEFKCEN